MSALIERLRALVEAEPGFAAAAGALAAGRNAHVPSVPPGVRAPLLAALARRGPLLVVVPSEDEVGPLVDDLDELTGDVPVLRNPTLDLFQEEEEQDLEPAVRVGARLRVLQALREGRPLAVVTSPTALLQRLPAPERGALDGLELRRGATLDPAGLARRLVEVGHSRVPLVEAPGEFALRGGIVDVFPLGSPVPVRIELFGDEVESLRTFEPGSQRSTGTVERWRLSLVAPEEWVRLRREDGRSLFAHLPAGGALALVDPGAVRARLESGARRFARDAQDLLTPAEVTRGFAGHPALLVGDAPDEPLAAGAVSAPLGLVDPGLHVGGGGIEPVTNELARLIQRGERVTVCCFNEAERERLVELFDKSGLDPRAADDLRGAEEPPGLTLVVLSIDDGFRRPATRQCLLVSHRLFARHRRAEVGTARGRGRRGAGHLPIESFADLEAGTYVVHVTHGVALFQGIVRRERDGQPRDFLQLSFDEGELFIPTDRIGLVRRYVGPTDSAPRLSKIGGQGWKKKTEKAEEAARDLAMELLEVQAERMARPGFAFPPDDPSQALFEESFAYTDTDDQIRVTAEVKRDMEIGRAMDRLVCGDVGYGKTEIAIRAAFRAVQAGKQVAVLCPTTVLAHQHERTFRERMAAYPIRVEAVSRFRSPGEQRVVLKDAREGKVDVLLGTHRILSKDVAFKDLGLVVIDEEQRFGVEHKERLKALRRTVDLLTLSATPIPRTLHLALSGARDISVLETPPPGRSPVETRVVRRSPELIRRAIERELAREGQVFLVTDRVRGIEEVADEVRALVPTARVLVVHGQLPETDIEERMLRFVDHEADVLVATTLIENGLDIKRANTLIVDRADRYGLAEMHQLRGRVGRSDARAYAYFLLPPRGQVSDVARRRLRAIEEHTDLGAGFRIALRDLEIRGAGNVLGAEQSGHIASVGYDLYCRLLKRAVAELKAGQQGKPLDLERDLDLEATEVEVVLDVPAYVPDAYVEDVALKIECYRKLAQAQEEVELARLREELRDRYGPLPEVFENLFRLRTLRIRAAGHGVLKVTRQDRVLQLRCRHAGRLQAGIRAHRQALRPIDTHMVYLVMQDPEGSDEVQLGYLLEALAPVHEDPAAAAARLDPQALREERRRKARGRGRRSKTSSGS